MSMAPEAISRANERRLQRKTWTVPLGAEGSAPAQLDKGKRICAQDITSFIRDKQAINRGLFDPEVVPEELAQGSPHPRNRYGSRLAVARYTGPSTRIARRGPAAVPACVAGDYAASELPVPLRW